MLVAYPVSATGRPCILLVEDVRLPVEPHGAAWPPGRLAAWLSDFLARYICVVSLALMD